MAKDIFHQAVKTALIKDEWTITHDPLYLNIAEVGIYILVCTLSLVNAFENFMRNTLSRVGWVE